MVWYNYCVHKLGIETQSFKGIEQMRYVISTIVLLISLNAQASLISIDLSTPDDGLLTLDTQSNLEWLDFSETAGMFAALVLADVGGWMSQGFRYATRSF